MGEFIGREGSVWLESDFCRDEGCRAMLFSDPVAEVVLSRPNELDRFFAELESWHGRGFHLAGWLDYEAGAGFEEGSFPDRAGRNDGLPIGWFGVYPAPRRFSAEEAEAARSAVGESGESAPYDLSFSLPEEAYAGKIEAVRREIAAGNVYQVNFTGRCRFRTDASPAGLFLRLHAAQPASYAALLRARGRTILSLSPELFFRTSGGAIETMPMKGTAARGRTPEEDRRLLRGLAGSAKDRAENLMIVDLLRNDLGRICRPGSVGVRELFATESWPTLHQMVSRIGGELREGTSLYDIFRALFPCGSVTGAPKVSAMRLIERLEEGGRGAYTGTVGWISPERKMVFSVAIRTVELQGGAGLYGAGGGIVWDSEPEAELRECRLKAAILGSGGGQAFGLFESILWNGEYLLLRDHLRRLEGSARELGLPFSEERALMELERLGRELRRKGPRFKVRLDLSAEGALSAEAVAIEAREGTEPLRIVLSEDRIDSLNPMLRHKTTLREFYDSRYRRALEAGFDEVLFLNERGEVAEGAISSLFVRKGDRLLTPPLSAGILDGVFRAYIFRTRPEAEERTLTLSDLRGADAIFMANAVRGMRPASFPEQDVGSSGR